MSTAVLRVGGILVNSVRKGKRTVVDSIHAIPGAARKKHAQKSTQPWLEAAAGRISSVGDNPTLITIPFPTLQSPPFRRNPISLPKPKP